MTLPVGRVGLGVPEVGPLMTARAGEAHFH
jgi:hypothetical protein